MNSFLLTIAGLVIAFFVAAFAVPHFINWNDYKGVLEEQASLITGHQVKVEGNVNLRLLPVPYVRFERVKIFSQAQNEIGQPAARPLLASADEFTLWLSAPPLLRGSIEARQVELARPRLYYFLGEEGKKRWQSRRFSLGDASGRKNAGHVRKGIEPASLQNQKTLGQGGKRHLKSGMFDAENVSLDNVDIRDGQIVFQRLNTSTYLPQTLFSSPKLSGKLMATSLRGPFKFRGRMKSPAIGTYNVGLSTGSLDKNKGMVVKASVIDSKRKQKWLLDGYARALASDLSYKGIWKAAVPAETFLDLPAAVAGKSSRTGGLQPVGIEARFNGSYQNINFSEIKATFVRGNLPQVLKLKSSVSWQNSGLVAHIDAASPLFDMDQLSGQHALEGRMSALAGYGRDAIEKILSPFAEAKLSGNFGQLTVGGGLVRDFRFKMDKEDKDLKLEHLEARLPGQNYLKLSGQFDTIKKKAFVGPLSLMGQNFRELVKWYGAVSSQRLKIVPPRPFLLDARLVSEAGSLELAAIHSDFSGSAVEGNIYLGQEKRGAKIQLDLRFSALNPDYQLRSPVYLHDMMMAMLPVKLADKVVKEKLSPGHVYTALNDFHDADIKISVGTLQLKDGRLSDVVLDVRRVADIVNIRKISFRTQKQLDVEVSGRLNGRRSSARRSVTIDLVSHAPEAVRQAVGLLLPKLTVANRYLVHDNLYPLRTTIDVRTGGEYSANSVVQVYGIAGASQIEGVAEFQNVNALTFLVDADKFAASRHSGELTFTSRDSASLLRQLLGTTRLRQKNFKIPANRPGIASLNWRGRLSRGLQLEFKTAMNGVDIQTEGRLQSRPKDTDRPWNFTGKTRFQAPDPNLLAAYLGVDTSFDWRRGRVDLAADTEVSGARTVYKNISGRIGTSATSGQVELVQLDKKLKIAGNLKTGSLLVDGLLTGLQKIDVDKAEVALTAANDNSVAATKEKKNVAASRIWSGREFDLSILENLDADLKISADNVVLGPLAKLESGALELVIHEGRLNITGLSGQLGEGRADIEMSISRGQTATQVAGSIKLADVKAGRLLIKDDGAPHMRGDISGKFDFKGEGLSPLGVVSLLSGKGEVKLSDLEITDLSPDLLLDMTREELARKEDPDHPVKPLPFNERLEKHLLGKAFHISARTLQVRASDGILKMDPLQAEDENARLEVNAHLLLSSLVLDSRWKFSPTPASERPELPPVTMILDAHFDGDRFVASRKLQSGSLQRFLAVLRIENDVNRLEEINKSLPVAPDAPKPVAPSATDAAAPVAGEGKGGVAALNAESWQKNTVIEKTDQAGQAVSSTASTTVNGGGVRKLPDLSVKTLPASARPAPSMQPPGRQSLPANDNQVKRPSDPVLDLEAERKRLAEIAARKKAEAEEKARKKAKEKKKSVFWDFFGNGD